MTHALHLSFVHSQLEFQRMVDLFDPEPHIIQFASRFASYPQVDLNRLITWSGLSRSGETIAPLYDYRLNPTEMTLMTLCHNADLTNFSEILSHNQAPVEGLVNFYFSHVDWFIKLRVDRNPYVPSYAPKRLNNGLRFSLNATSLTVSLERVSHTLWFVYKQNEINVIPLTAENLAIILDFYYVQALTFMASSSD